LLKKFENCKDNSAKLQNWMKLDEIIV